jgi:hypothetical protein
MGSRLPYDSARHNPRTKVTRVPDHAVDSWEPWRSELAADVGRVADRLRSMSQARLEGQVAPGDDDLPSWGTRAQAGREMANCLSEVAASLESAAVGESRQGHRGMPELHVFAAGDQVAVGGHDLLAAMELVAPDTEVWFEHPRPARDAVEHAQRLLADLRRRL